jgi:putative nucleotidyltransferase with HDIG domain
MQQTIGFFTQNTELAVNLKMEIDEDEYVLYSLPLDEFTLEKISAFPPHVLLVEVRSPKQVAVIRSILTRPKLRKLPIIALLAIANEQMLKTVLRAGVREVVTIKIPADDLLRRIRKVSPAGPTAEKKAADGGNSQWSDPESTAFKKKVHREVNSRLEQIPSLPVLVMEIIQLADSDTSSAGDFERHISMDQALTARVLKVANSSFFAQSRTIKSIRDAIVVLGYRTLKSVVMAATTSKLLDKPAEGYGYMAGGLWKHSIACAVGCRLFAKKLRWTDVEAEEMFVQGLLHDLGKLLLSSFVTAQAEPFTKAVVERKLPLTDAENMLLGTNHTKIGYRIAERWNLPVEVRVAIKNHHNPERSGDLQRAVSLVNVVNQFCFEQKIGMFPDSPMGDPLDEGAMGFVNITPQFIEENQEAFLSQLNEMEKIISVAGSS